MTPRRYTLGLRTAAAAQTRERIVDAALALHAERGIVGTKPADVATRADVTLTTYYKHFPQRGDLVRACTTRGRELIPPPDPSVIGTEPPSDRIRTAVALLFDYYAAREPWLYAGRTEERYVPEIEPVMARLRDLCETCVKAALGDGRSSRHFHALAKVLTDFWAWRTFRHEAGLSQADAIQCVSDALTALRRGPARVQRPRFQRSRR